MCQAKFVQGRQTSACCCPRPLHHMRLPHGTDRPLAPLRPLPAAAPGPEGEPPLLGEEGQRVLHECRELDYMTHIVLRMFEITS